MCVQLSCVIISNLLDATYNTRVHTCTPTHTMSCKPHTHIYVLPHSHITYTTSLDTHVHIRVISHILHLWGSDWALVTGIAYYMNGWGDYANLANWWHLSCTVPSPHKYILCNFEDTIITVFHHRSLLLSSLWPVFCEHWYDTKHDCICSFLFDEDKMEFCQYTSKSPGPKNSTNYFQNKGAEIIN